MAILAVVLACVPVSFKVTRRCPRGICTHRRFLGLPESLIMSSKQTCPLPWGMAPVCSKAVGLANILEKIVRNRGQPVPVLTRHTEARESRGGLPPSSIHWLAIAHPQYPVSFLYGLASADRLMGTLLCWPEARA